MIRSGISIARIARYWRNCSAEVRRARGDGSACAGPAGVRVASRHVGTALLVGAAVFGTHSVSCDTAASEAMVASAAFSGAFDGEKYSMLLTSATSPDLPAPQRIPALLELSLHVADLDNSYTAVPRLTSAEQLVRLAELSGTSEASSDPAFKRAALELLSQFARIPNWPALRQTKYLDAIVACLTDRDAGCADCSVHALASLVVDPETRIDQYGPNALRPLVRTAAKSDTSPDVHADAVIALAGCCSRQAFREGEYVDCGVVQALTQAIQDATASGKGPRFAITALRELSRKAIPGGHLDKQFVEYKVISNIQDALNNSTNIWTKRSASKALVTLMKNKKLLEQSGVTVDQLLVSIEAAGKQDWMCARWAREAEKWKRNPVEKKWYET